jgi:hypothetical protein
MFQSLLKSTRDLKFEFGFGVETGNTTYRGKNLKTAKTKTDLGFYYGPIVG